jgi:Fe-S-cluster containining protein
MSREANPYLDSFECPRCGHCCPERTWVGLTAYEIQEIHSGNQHWGDFACAIEAKLKEKNQ